MGATLALQDLKKLTEGLHAHRNLSTPQLVETAIARGEGRLAANGALVAMTGARTGRSPRDKFTVEDDETRDRVEWGKVNQPFPPEKFQALLERVLRHMAERDLYIMDLAAGADPAYQLPVQFICEYAWHALFVKQLFVRPDLSQLATHSPEFMVIAAPEFEAIPDRDGVRSSTFILADFTRRIILIGGTKYAGEMKKSIFGVMNYLLPGRDVFPMHCSANIGGDGSSALFFGLSGTGKTTLSADPDAASSATTNMAGAPTASSTSKAAATPNASTSPRKKSRRFTTPSASARCWKTSSSIRAPASPTTPTFATRKTRAPPIPSNSSPTLSSPASAAIHATCSSSRPTLSASCRPSPSSRPIRPCTTSSPDTPPSSPEPKPASAASRCRNFPHASARRSCRCPAVYAEMLGRRLREHRAQCWLVNTGWSGGAFGVGRRMSLTHTRAMVHAALDGRLAGAEFVTEDAFGLSIPTTCPDVPGELLNPRNAWADKDAYDHQARLLASKFEDNFRKFDAPDEVRPAGPRTS